jgi:hypothetical protein
MEGPVLNDSFGRLGESKKDDQFFSAFGPARVLSVNEVYDPATNKWESRAPDVGSAQSCVRRAVNGKIYVIGGRTGHAFILTATNTDVVEEYNPVSKAGVVRKSGCRQLEAEVSRARTAAGSTWRR